MKICLPHGLLDFRYILNAPRIRYIPNKKETHHVEPINSQEDPKWWTSFVYIGPEVCQLLNHYTYINCVKNKIGHKPSGGQIVKSHKISVFILLPCKKKIQAMEIVSVDQIILRHLFFANSIFNFIICDY